MTTTTTNWQCGFCETLNPGTAQRCSTCKWTAAESAALAAGEALLDLIPDGTVIAFTVNATRYTFTKDTESMTGSVLWTARQPHTCEWYVYATPGWEGLPGVPLTYCKEDCDPFGGNVPFVSTGVAALDAKLYLAIVKRVLFDVVGHGTFHGVDADEDQPDARTAWTCDHCGTCHAERPEKCAACGGPVAAFCIDE